MTEMQIGDGMKITVGDAPEEKSAFQTTYDSDGGEHLGILMTEEEIETRLRYLREFYSRGMIPFLCPTCGKLWGANYDVGSLRWFRCSVCNAEWELQNDEEVNKGIDRKKGKRTGKLRIVRDE